MSGRFRGDFGEFSGANPGANPGFDRNGSVSIVRPYYTVFWD